MSNTITEHTNLEAGTSVTTKTTIDDVRRVVERKLPRCWPPLEACLSTVGAATLKDVYHCMGLVLVGSPGGRKGTTIGMLGTHGPMFRCDDFTPASFVSHDAKKTEAQLQKIDLLPQIKHRILVVDELGPLFSKRYEDLVQGIGVLTKVMDGKGYITASGTHGPRGYEGDYRFNMICGTTPLEHRVWEALGKLSSRWIFYNIGQDVSEGDMRQDYGAATRECGDVVQRFLEDFWQGYASVDWDRLKDDQTWLELLQWSADTICSWRGLIPRQDPTGVNPPVIETPSRLRETLYALARGHALLWERKKINSDDVFFAVDINETNMPEDRYRVKLAFNKALEEHIAKGGTEEDMFSVGIGLREAAKEIRCSEDKATRVLEELETLGVLRKDVFGKWYREL